MTGIAFLGSIIVLWVFHQQLAAPGDALDIYSAQRHVMERICLAGAHALTLDQPVIWARLHGSGTGLPQCSLGLGKACHDGIDVGGELARDSESDQKRGGACGIGAL